MAQMVKNLPTVQETWVRILPGEGNVNPLQEFLSEEFHGQRSLAGYSPKGHKELDRTEELTHTHTHNKWSRSPGTSIQPCGGNCRGEDLKAQRKKLLLWVTHVRLKNLSMGQILHKGLEDIEFTKGIRKVLLVMIGTLSGRVSFVGRGSRWEML